MATTGYPGLKFDAFETPRQLADYNNRFGLGRATRRWDAPAFSHTIIFFEAVVDAIVALKGRIQIEILGGELVQTMSKMKIKSDESRPPAFPRSFTRAWLSNVPCAICSTHSFTKCSLFR